ncbi:beta-lactamase-like protein [Hysterangium stoloniferum]|nr:beta-lactamase-like protein [Hysterangium stoloniferum]
MGRIPETDLYRPICGACGTQFEGPNPPSRCHICDDPRQYVPPSGQTWTTLKESQSKFKNVIEPLPGAGESVYTIVTQPRFPIGQRCHLIRTPQGNILWDLIAFIDDETVQKIDELGGIQAIVISHPHFYTTHSTWSHVFGKIPVYLASDDERWLSRRDASASSIRKFITSPVQEIIPESAAVAIKAGGHFPGSMVLHWKNRLFTADTVMVVPSGLYDIERLDGTVSFAFLWSYPNMIPLPSDAISSIIERIAPFEFDAAHGGFSGQDIQRDAKQKLIKSADIIRNTLAGIRPGEQKASEFWR